MTRKNPPMPDRPTVVDVVVDALTQTVFTLEGLQQQQRELAQQQHPPQVPQPDVPEDPAYDWDRFRLPMATSFPVPCTGRVQRMGSELLACLPTLAGRDQKEATFVLNMTADWPGLDDDSKSIVFQRLYLWLTTHNNTMAAYGWPTAVAATYAVGGDAVPLPPGMAPVTAARRGRSQQGRRQDAPQQQQQQQQPQQQRQPQQRGREGQRRNKN